MTPEAWESGTWVGDGFRVGQDIDNVDPDQITYVVTSPIGDGSRRFASMSHNDLEFARDVGTEKMREILEAHHFAELAHAFTPELPPRPEHYLPAAQVFRSLRLRIRIRGGARIWARRHPRMAGK
jgi:hypothetical protein